MKLMNDLISRQAAINAIRKIYDSVGILGEKWAVDKCQMAIKDLPFAQRTGRWINAYPEIEPNPMFMYGICSECGFEQSISDKLNYCPNCGADMRGEEV